ncbi:hypothetical protein [Streptomyces sp. ISL-100]|uniref:hypothetical protein n=1 Tax=Streptomyces sp. ISL-100 TaxID=2819173 RepID=UPI001BE936FD|nr:hypothetical protein [Streptomyces sp. ISL-100]MBT2401144.1 hypothetical protein [Streptomyces sp. ISL-100]
MITPTTVSGWLAHAHELPLTAETEWSDHNVAVLPLGNRFDAVRLPTEIVHAAAASDEQQKITGFLAEVIRGPVVHDPYAWYYALVPPQTTETWRAPFATCLGRGSWLGVPRADRITPVGGPYWAVPMERAGDLCSPATVAHVVALGHDRLVNASSTATTADSPNWCGWHDGPTDTELEVLWSETNSGPPMPVPACEPCRKAAAAEAEMRAAERAS